MTSITLQTLQAIFPAAPFTILARYVDPINVASKRYEITSVVRMAMFIAQVGFESTEFQHIEENLNYGAPGLLATFPTHFTAAEAEHYARHPQEIANRVYANRFGNGTEASGDGWKYRGRGLIQLTFKANYADYCKALNMQEAQVFTWLSSPEGATDVAGWFWNKNRLNVYADSHNLIQCTKIINGGVNGLDQRLIIYNKALSVIV